MGPPLELIVTPVLPWIPLGVPDTTGGVPAATGVVLVPTEMVALEEQAAPASSRMQTATVRGVRDDMGSPSARTLAHVGSGAGSGAVGCDAEPCSTRSLLGRCCC